MAINTIDDSLPTATKIAGLSCLLTMAIVVFANYGLLNPLSFRAMPRKPLGTSWPTKDNFVSPSPAF